MPVQSWPLAYWPDGSLKWTAHTVGSGSGKLTLTAGDPAAPDKGKWAGLGTRHGVQHYADSAKQQRIANTTYRRYYYFLTADERVGDLMHANVDSDETFLVLDPIRKIRTEPYTPDRHACRSASAPTGAVWCRPG